MGVSTSMKSHSAKVERSDCTTRGRIRAMVWASGRTMRSTYRWRDRVSSLRSLCATGSGCSAFDANIHDPAMTLSSPVRLEMTSPCTATMSPMSTMRFHESRPSSPATARDTITCSSAPPPSRRRAKHSLPAVRRKMTRPVMETVLPVLVSGSRCPNSARTESSE